MKIALKSIVGGAILHALCTAAVQGVDRYWVSMTSSNWNNPSNWSDSPGGSSGFSVPGLNDNAIFDGVASNNGDCLFDGVIDVSTLTVNGFSGSIITQNNSVLIRESFFQNTGVVSLQSSSVTVEGDITISGGGFNAGVSTIALSGPKNQQINMNGAPFFHFVVDKFVGIVDYMAALNIDGNYHHKNSGQINYGPYYHTVRGNFTHDNGSSTFQPTGGVIFNGAGTQVIGGAVAKVLFPNVIINSSGSVIPVKPLRIITGSGEGGDFTLLNGTFVAGNFTHDILGDWKQMGGSFNAGSSTIQFVNVGSSQAVVAAKDPFHVLSIGGAAGFDVFISTNVEANELKVNSGHVRFMSGSGKHIAHNAVNVMDGKFIIEGSTVSLDPGRMFQIGDGFLEMRGAARLETSVLASTGPSIVLMEDNSSSGPVFLTPPDAGYMDVGLDGSINISSVVFNRLNGVGLTVGPNSNVITLSTIVFQNGISTGTSLRWQLNAGGTYSLDNLVFLSSGAGGINIDATGITNPTINVYNAQGPRAGSTFEIDPNNRINWIPDPSASTPTITNLNPYFSFVGLDIINVYWTNATTASYVAVLSQDPSFATNYSSFSIGFNNYNYTGLSQNTTYYFKVKVATESDAGYSAPISTKTASGSGNSALYFDGNNKIASIPHHTKFDFQNDTTLEFWFRRQATSGTVEHIISKDNNGLTNGWAVTIQNTGHIKFLSLNGGGVQTINPVNDLNWHHFAVSRKQSDGRTKIYLDGNYVTDSLITSLSVNTFEVNVGNSKALLQDFNGIVDEIRFWNYLRSDAQIAGDRFVQVSTADAGLIGYWKLDEGVGQVGNDATAGSLNVRLGTATIADSHDPQWVTDFIPGFGAPPDVTAPTAKVLHPTNGSTQTVTSLMIISGTAQDNQTLTKVEIAIQRMSDGYTWVNTTAMTGYWAAAYAYNQVPTTQTWTFGAGHIPWSPGNYRVEVHVEDGNFNHIYDSVTFTVESSSDAVPPSIYINYPVVGSTYAPSSLTSVYGTAFDNESLAGVAVRFKRLSDGYFWNGSSVNWVPTTYDNFATGLSSWTYTVPVSAWQSNGAYVMAAEAKDAANLVTVSSITFLIDSSTNAASDTISPTIRIVHPSSGSTHSSAVLYSLYGTANDNIANNINDVSARIKDLNTGYYWNGSQFISVAEYWNYAPVTNNGSFYNWTYSAFSSASWVNGRNYEVTVRATDGNGNISIDLSVFTVNNGSTGDTIYPIVSIDAPIEGGVYAPHAVAIAGTASDNVGLSAVRVSLKNEFTNYYYDGVGFASGVELFFNVSGLSFWSFNVSSVAFTNANYLLVAVASDTSGLTSNAFRHFTVSGASATSDVTIPTVAITSPTNGANYTDAFLLTNIFGTANDDTSLIEVAVSLRDDSFHYFNGFDWSSTSEVWKIITGNLYAWQEYFPYSSWKNGSFLLRARARDSANNVAYSSVTFTVSGSSGTGGADTQPPAIFIYNPVNNAFQSPYSFTLLNGRAEDPFGVSQIFMSLLKVSSGTYWTGSGFNSPSEVFLSTPTSLSTFVDWAFAIPYNAYDNGSYLFKVKARDASGNESVMTSSFTVTGTVSGAGDFTPPIVVIQKPQTGLDYTASQMTLLSGTAYDNVNLSYVQVRIRQNSSFNYWNGASWGPTEYWMGTVGSSSWTFTAPVGMWASTGSYTVSARAYDPSNNVSAVVSSSMNITGSGSAGSPPTVGILKPQTTAYTPSQLTTLSGTVNDTDSGILRVQIQITNGGLSWNPSSFTWTSLDYWYDVTFSTSQWSTSQVPIWPAGEFYIRVRADDSTGLQSIAVSRQFFVTLSSGTGTSDFTPPAAITNLTASPGSTIGSVYLAWTAPGDDGNVGTASSYIIKYRTDYPITSEADWTAAQNIQTSPIFLNPSTPSVAGSSQSMTVTGLSVGVPYFWSIRARDEVGNTGPLSNSPPPVFAFNGGTAGTGDGEGTASIIPSTIVDSTVTVTTITFTVGASGITSGGKISIRVPDGWIYPQTWGSLYAGYVEASASNNTVLLEKIIEGQMVHVKLISGTLNAGDKVTIAYRAQPICAVRSAVPFKIMSQATSGGLLKEISSHPTISVVAGSASRLGFNVYEKFVTLNQVSSVAIQGQSNCGSTATVANNTPVSVAAVIWDNVLYRYTIDPNAQLSTSSAFTSPFSSATIVLPAGQSTLPVYYRLTSLVNKGNNKIRMNYLDLQTGAYTNSNEVWIIPSASSQPLSNVSVDTNVRVATQTTATITPNGDGIADFAFINFETADPSMSWRIEILTNDLSTVIWDRWGSGQFVRESWDGRRSYPYNDMAPAGAYRVRITAGGAVNTSLTINVSVIGLTGLVQNAISSAPVTNAFVNAYGFINRYTQTDSSGTFSLTGLPNGVYQLRIEKSGYVAHVATVSMSGSSVNLGTIRLQPLAKIVFNGTRSDTALELWGQMKAIGGGQDLRAMVHFAAGRAVADDGASTNSPELYLTPGVPYTISANLPGYDVSPLNYTLANGETYLWNVDLAVKNSILGVIRLANGIVNTTGVNVYLAAGLDANRDFRFDLGTPAYFVNAYIPPYEYQVNYAFPGFSSGTYLVQLNAAGFALQQATVTLTGANKILDFTLSRGGMVTVAVQFNGDTTPLDIGGGKFPVTLKLDSTTGFNALQTEFINTHAVATSGSVVFTGIADGTYTIRHERINGFGLNTTTVPVVVVSSGVGTASLTFVRHQGILVGNVALPAGRTMSDLLIRLAKDTFIDAAPQIISTTSFRFSNLESGLYTLSVIDSPSGAAETRLVNIINNQTTTVSISFQLNRFYTVSGVVRTNASPPRHTLAAIAAEAVPTTIYTATGTHVLNGFRVEAYLVNSDNSIDPLPTTAGSVWNPAKIKFSDINISSGLYQISGLKEGSSYRVRLNPDITNDGIPDFPIEEYQVTLFADKANLDFTIRDGASIVGTVTAPEADNGHRLTITITDVDLKTVVGSADVTLVGTDATFTFTNLRVGRYLIQVLDSDSPAKYAAKPNFVTIETASEQKTVAITLTRGSVIRGKLRDKNNVLINADNVRYLLPEDFKIRLEGKGQVVDAVGPDADGNFIAEVLPDVEYDVHIKPPLNRKENDRGKGFLPIILRLKSPNTWGEKVLEAGVDVTGVVRDSIGNPIANIPVWAYQSLSRTLEPVLAKTNDQGVFTFEALDSRVRFYDFVANTAGKPESLMSWTEGQRAMIDITKPAQIENLVIVLDAVSGSLNGRAISVSSNTQLIAAYGAKAGLAGASLVLRKHGERKLLEFLTEADGNFSVLLADGKYDLEILAQGHVPYIQTNIQIKGQAVQIGTVTLQAGYKLSGTLRNADGSLPSQSQVSELIAISTNQVVYRANLIKDDLSKTVDRYGFHGLLQRTYKLVALDQLNRVQVLKEAFSMPDQDATLDLIFELPKPQLVANFIQKLPDGVEAIFGCNQPFRNNPDDLDGNGIADDDEFLNFITILRGNETNTASLAFDSVSDDRKKASYTYTIGSEASRVLELRANFLTSEINPQTGTNFIASGTFVHPIGLQAQQEDIVNNLGGGFVLPGGAEFDLPANWNNDVGIEGAIVRFQAADGLDDLDEAAQAAPRGASVLALSRKLGASAYPMHMFKAIRALDSPDVADKLFSSFYDIFLPASVRRVFTNRATLTLRYDDDVEDPMALNIYYFNESQGVYTIENNDRRIDTTNKTISVSIGHASVFTVLASSVPIIRGDAYASGDVNVFNFPNPFDLQTKTVTLQDGGGGTQVIQGTMIKVSLPATVAGMVEIDIYNVAGDKVRTISTGSCGSGEHCYIGWDGQNEHGADVASGIYIGRLTIGGGNEKFFKMAVIK